MRSRLFVSALILALIGYAIIYFFELHGSVTWVVYGCVVGLPIVLIPFITNKAAPDLAQPLLALPLAQPLLALADRVGYFFEGEEFFDAREGGRRRRRRR
jgi:hypothetical protein